MKSDQSHYQPPKDGRLPSKKTITGKKQHRPIVRCKVGLLDAVRVPLNDACTIYATIEARDYDRLIAEGLTAMWSADSNRLNGPRYVRCAVTGLKSRKVSIARLLTGASQREVVHYNNGNTFDLTRKNLYIGSGSAKRDDYALVMHSIVQNGGQGK